MQNALRVPSAPVGKIWYLPAVQLRQAACGAVASHVSQPMRPAPARPSAHCVFTAYLPEGQLVHALLPSSGWNFPEGQQRHAIALATKRPGRHTWQRLAAALYTAPAGHDEHARAPVPPPTAWPAAPARVKRPAGHVAQAKDPCPTENFPSGHLPHSPLLPPAKRPAWHAPLHSGVVSPLPLDHRPGSQAPSQRALAPPPTP